MIEARETTFTTEQEGGGRGAWFLERFLYWGGRPSRSAIYLERWQENLYRGLAFLTWLSVFAGWLALGSWLYINRADIFADPFLLLSFWSKFDPLILAFLLSLWLDLFLYYRSSRRRAALKKIDYRFWSKAPGRLGRKKYDVSAAYSEPARHALEDAYILASRLHQPQAEVIHLFRVLLRTPEV